MKSLKKSNKLLKSMQIDTPLGPMLALADEDNLLLLEFLGKKGLQKEIFGFSHGFEIAQGQTPPLLSIASELKAYFAGKLTHFSTPYQLQGSAFQKEVWQGLTQIPYGETRSYAALSLSLGRAKSFRAVGNANGSNCLAVLVPCHRVIASDGSLGGYSSGLALKQWLLEHEKRHALSGVC